MPRKHKKHHFHILIPAAMIITLVACMIYAAREKDYLPFALFIIGILEMYLNTYWTMSVSGRRIGRSGAATFLTVLIWCYVINQITKNADKSYVLTVIYAVSCSIGTMFTMTLDDRRRRKRKEQQEKANIGKKQKKSGGKKRRGGKGAVIHKEPKPAGTTSGDPSRPTAIAPDAAVGKPPTVGGL